MKSAKHIQKNGFCRDITFLLTEWIEEHTDKDPFIPHTIQLVFRKYIATGVSSTPTDI